MGLIRQAGSHSRVSDTVGGGVRVDFEAEDTRLERPVGLEFPLPRMAKKPGPVERFALTKRASGKPTFPDTSGAWIYEAILCDAPVPPPQLNPDLSTELKCTIAKAPEKDGEVQCQEASELRGGLKRMSESQFWN